MGFGSRSGPLLTSRVMGAFVSSGTVSAGVWQPGSLLCLCRSRQACVVEDLHGGRLSPQCSSRLLSCEPRALLFSASSDSVVKIHFCPTSHEIPCPQLTSNRLRFKYFSQHCQLYKKWLWGEERGQMGWL